MSKILIEEDTVKQALNTLLILNSPSIGARIRQDNAIDDLREALAEQQQEPIYQLKKADGSWIDQAKHSYDYNVKHWHATVRIVYPSPQPAQQEPVTPTSQDIQNAAANLALMKEMFGDAQAPVQQEPESGCNPQDLCAGCRCKYAAQPAQPLPFGVGGGLVAIKTLLSRDPCGHANTAIQMIDAILAEQPAQPQVSSDERHRDAQELPFETWWETQSQQAYGRHAKTLAWTAWCAAAPQIAQQGMPDDWFKDMPEEYRREAWRIKEQPAQQEPWGAFVDGRVFVGRLPEHVRKFSENAGVPIQWLYTSPLAQRTWVGLTDEEIEEMANDFEEGYVFLYRSFARAIEAAHGIKENT